MSRTSTRLTVGGLLVLLALLVVAVVSGVGGASVAAATSVRRDPAVLPTTGGLHWPCGPIDVWVNPAGAPEDWRPQLQQALRTIDSDTGLGFRLAGTTDQRPARDLKVTTPEALVTRPSVLLAWGSRAQYPAVLGVNARQPNGAAATTVVTWVPWRILGAQVVFDPASSHRQLHLFLHELGHVVGLGHSTEPTSPMQREADKGTNTFTPDDRAKLATAGC